MKKQEVANKLLEEYKQFLEKKNYKFEEKFIVELSKDSNKINYITASKTFVISVTEPANVIHEVTHAVLLKDGIELEITEDTENEAVSFLKVPDHRDFSKDFLNDLRGFMTSFVSDYYVNYLLLKFSEELPKGELKEGIADCFKWTKFAEKQSYGDVTRLIKIRRELTKKPIFVIQCHISRGFLTPQASAFDYPGQFSRFLEELYGLRSVPENFFKRRVELIQRFIRSLPKYETLKEESNKAGVPYPIAKLSVRLLNILYYGLEMESAEGVSKLSSILGQKVDYATFISRGQGRGLKFSLLLV